MIACCFFCCIDSTHSGLGRQSLFPAYNIQASVLLPESNCIAAKGREKVQLKQLKQELKYQHGQCVWPCCLYASSYAYSIQFATCNDMSNAYPVHVRKHHISIIDPELMSSGSIMIMKLSGCIRRVQTRCPHSPWQIHSVIGRAAFGSIICIQGTTTWVGAAQWATMHSERAVIAAHHW